MVTVRELEDRDIAVLEAHGESLRLGQVGKILTPALPGDRIMGDRVEGPATVRNRVNLHDGATDLHLNGFGGLGAAPGGVSSRHSAMFLPCNQADLQQP
jgi:hypothetical protein